MSEAPFEEDKPTRCPCGQPAEGWPGEGGATLCADCWERLCDDAWWRVHRRAAAGLTIEREACREFARAWPGARGEG